MGKAKWARGGQTYMGKKANHPIGTEPCLRVPDETPGANPAGQGTGGGH